MAAKSVPRRKENSLDPTELRSRIMQRFCEGRTPTEISREFKAHGVTRQTPHQILKEEGRAGKLLYSAPLELVLGRHIERQWPKLERARVVHSVEPGHVALQTAELLVELIRRHFASAARPREIHLGFAGGRLLRETARALAMLLESEPSLLPRRQFHFHAMLASFNARNPWNDPNAFFGYFADSPVIDSTFWGLPAPGIVSPAEFESLRKVRGVMEAFEQAEKLDIVVTSAGAHWDSQCSRLSKLYGAAAYQRIGKENALGDLMWRPLNDAGPILTDTPERAMTLFEISRLAELVRQHRRVVIAAGLCGTCGKPKDRVLRAILNWSRPDLQVVTDLVLDSLTARAMLTEPGS